MKRVLAVFCSFLLTFSAFAFSGCSFSSFIDALDSFVNQKSEITNTNNSNGGGANTGNSDGDNSTDIQEEVQLLAEHREGYNTSTKKGICAYRYNTNKEADYTLLSNLNVGWYYNWDNQDKTEWNVNAEFVPMVFKGEWNVNTETINRLKGYYEEGKAKYLLTFNEPDHTDQANMTPEKALSYWPQLETIGIPLVSPAPANYNTDSTDNWLDQFMNGAIEKGYRVDCIALHCYQDFASPYSPAQLENLLNVVYERYHLPIWVTEFGAVDTTQWWVPNWQPRPECNYDSAAKYLQEACEVMERLPFVERYAWFIDNYGRQTNPRPAEGEYSALYDNNDKITKVGEAYRDFESQVVLEIETKEVADITINQDYSFTFLSCGGKGKYEFSIAYAKDNPASLSGLKMAKNGLLSGKVTVPNGTYKITVTVKDEAGRTCQKDFELKIVAE